MGQQIFQKISFTKEFEPTLEKFMQMIKFDRDILNLIKEENKKKGLFSPSVRYLIENYVKNNWEAFQRKLQDVKTKTINKEKESS